MKPDLNTPTDPAAVKPARTPWVVTAAALTVALVAMLALNNELPFIGPAPAKPVPLGATIIIPDNQDPGVPNDEFPTDPGDYADGLEPDYIDPADLDQYRQVDNQGRVTLTVPVTGECPIEPSGRIGAPANYRHACFHEHNGAVVYTSHAVRGPRTGALENIRFLQPGQVVTLADVRYRVVRLEVHPADRLPDYLFHPGNVMLLTCNIDAAVEAGGEFTKSDVIVLETI